MKNQRSSSANWSKNERCTSVYNRRGKLETLSCSGECYSDHLEEIPIEQRDLCCEPPDVSALSTSIFSTPTPHLMDNVIHRTVYDVSDPAVTLEQQVLDAEVTAFETRILVAQMRKSTLPPPSLEYQKKLLSKGSKG